MTGTARAAGALILALNASVALADPVAEFYEGRTVTVVAPSGTGGSIYLYALLLSEHIGRHIPGTPTVVAESRPGGGGVRAANWVDQAAPGDGTVIAEIHSTSAIEPLMGGADYDPREFQWLGSLVTRPFVGAVWHTVEADRLEDLGDERLAFAASGAGGISYQYPAFIRALSGANIDIVPGYSGGGEMNLAMERGEVQGRGNYYQAFEATNPDWLEDGTIKFLFRFGGDHPDLMDVPTAESYVDTEEEGAMLALLEAPLRIGRAFYVDDRVPAERAEALRAAFEATVNDPEFLAAAERMGLDVAPRSASEIQAVLERVYETPPEVVEGLKAIVTPSGG